MKNRTVFWQQFYCLITTIIFYNGLLLPAQTTPSPQKKPDKPKQSQHTEPREYVEVVNIAMILRALKKGQPVADLKKEDFTLYENGKPRPLTSFQEIRRKVGQRAKDETLTPRVEEKTAPAPSAKKRLFFLFFWISEPDPKIPETLDYFFSQVYRDGDYVLLIDGIRVFRITRRSQVEPVLASFNTALAQVVEKKRLAKQKLADQLEESVREFLAEIHKNPGQQTLHVGQLFNWFGIAQKNYADNSIGLAGEKLKAIAASLKKIDIEKWGFVFFQQDRFPGLNVNSIRGLKGPPAVKVKIQMALEKLAPKMSPQLSLQTINSFQQAFIEANITSHLLLSHPTSMGKMNTVYLKHIVAHTDWQQAFRGISEATGGGIIVDNNFQESILQAVEREDVFYRITYAPAPGGDERRKIRIQTKLPGIKLQYHRQVIVSPADKIAVDHLSFTPPLLEFTLKNYRQFFDGTRLYGDIQLKITSVDKNGNRRAFNKIFEPIKEEMTVSMNLDFPSGGDYALIIEANDRQTGQTALINQKITVPKNKYELEPVLVTEALEETDAVVDQGVLASLLKKSARYCEKLKKATFYFICTEEVIDNHWLKRHHVRKDHYLYNYQIIREEDGNMNENRELKPVSMELIEKRKRELGIPKDQQILITNFFSSYPFLMPVSMLAEENQSKYRYRLLGTNTLAGKTLYKVSVEPTQKGIREKDSNYGFVWLDGQDGSVYKIQLDANCLEGLDALKKLARKKRNLLKVFDVHWYEVQRKGIRFPSRTEINCSFQDWEQIARVVDRFNVVPLEKVGTVFEYKKYKFFNVNVDVVETSQQ